MKWALGGVHRNAKKDNNIFRYGQFDQDFFVNSLLDIDGGFFLDIGAGIGGLDVETTALSIMSNTYGLEMYRKWHGIAIDYDAQYIEAAKPIRRRCNLLCVDLMENNINELLAQHDCPTSIDYLSFDVDAAQEKVFDEFDFSKYHFQIITYEHNLYQGCVRQQQVSRSRFDELGYKLLFGNVGRWDDEPVEDWYVNAELFEKYRHLKHENIDSVQIIQMLRTQI